MAKERFPHFSGVLLLFCALLLASCQSADPNQELSKISKELDSLVNLTKQKVNDLTPNTDELTKSTSEEVEKLFVIEYKVFELTRNATAQEAEKALAELGRERWECFHTESTETHLRFYLKRPAKTYLRYVPRLF